MACVEYLELLGAGDLSVLECLRLAGRCILTEVESSRRDNCGCER
jgi:hypothetical protein